MRSIHPAAAIVAAMLLASAPAAAPAAPKAAVIELHVGVRDVAYIGQRLDDLIKRWPDAEMKPFAGQDDVVSVKAAAAGISCIAVGAPGALVVASVGFNLDGSEDGLGEAPYRTGKGIGKGSTVNDLLEAYGPPAEIVGEQKRRSAPADPGPSAPRKYQYKNADGTVKTFFLVQDNMVRRVVVNDLAPLDQHVVKGHSKN